jgi:ribonuclease BN (tRNA processing enzyme)
MVALRRAGIDLLTIDAIALTHLHGDHFGALPFLILDAQFRRRTAPLIVAGPRGVQQRVDAAMEVFFPGSTSVARRFTVDFVELTDGVAVHVGGMTVTPFAVVHPSGAPAHALRVDDGERVVTYSGDTEWTDRLLDATRGADLFVCEAYVYDRRVKFHLSHENVRAHRDAFGARRILLTHMGPDMLAREPDAAFACAHDGLVIEL